MKISTGTKHGLSPTTETHLWLQQHFTTYSLGILFDQCPPSYTPELTTPQGSFRRCDLSDCEEYSTIPVL